MIDNGQIELFAGYDGLGTAIAAALGTQMVAYSEWDDGPAAILAHHYPGIPNLGDITLIDWDALAADYRARNITIKVIGGGSPCQDLSLAGRRAGMTDGTRSNLWANMREGIATLRPEFVVWENVRGALSAYAVSDADGDHSPHQRAELDRLEAMVLEHQRLAEQATTEDESEYHHGQAAKYLEQHEGLLGGAGSRHLRALGRVLGDLADLGYDCQWRGLRASDVGSCHARFRVFLLARRRDVTAADPDGGNGGRSADLGGAGGRSEEIQGGRFGTAGDADGADVEGQRTAGLEVAHLAPEPRQPRGASAAAPDSGSERAGRDAGESPAEETGALSSDGPGDDLGERTAADWWATPADANGVGCERCGSPWRRWPGLEDSGDTPAHADGGDDPWGIGDTQRGPLERASSAGGSEAAGGKHDAFRSEAYDWGKYEAAIRRWEQVTGRPAPRPTEPTGRDGGERLSAEFAEWMMGMPEGWITAVPGVTRNIALKAAGNGVVPQQAYAALRHMLMTYRTHPAYQPV